MDISFFAHDPLIRKATLDYYKNLVDFAADIGALTLTIHPGKADSFPFRENKL